MENVYIQIWCEKLIRCRAQSNILFIVYVCVLNDLIWWREHFRRKQVHGWDLVLQSQDRIISDAVSWTARSIVYTLLHFIYCNVITTWLAIPQRDTFCHQNFMLQQQFNDNQILKYKNKTHSSTTKVYLSNRNLRKRRIYGSQRKAHVIFFLMIILRRWTM